MLKKMKKMLGWIGGRTEIGHRVGIKRRLLFLCLLCSMALGFKNASNAADLVLADKETSSYQIVIPDKSADTLADQWLLVAGKLIKETFQRNGFEVALFCESELVPGKPAIYLGATQFAHNNGIRTDFDDWTYVMKVVDKDIVIAGSDRGAGAAKNDIPDSTMALLGTVKGVCDFLREYAGVRFLFMDRGAQHKHAVKDGRMLIIKPDGSLNLDTRSIAFTPVTNIAVQENLDRQKKPFMVSHGITAGYYETLYFIANNFFPSLPSRSTANVYWPRVISFEKYGKSHPEYFALLPNGKRASDPYSGVTPGNLWGTPVYHLDSTNLDVQDLMVKAIEEKIEAGASSIKIGVLDSFGMTRCNCERCNQHFGMSAKNMEELLARSRTGRLWHVYFSIAERIGKKHPKVLITVLNYQDTPLDSEYIHKLGKVPDNLRVKVQYGSAQDLKKLEGIEFPAGLDGFSDTFNPFSYMGPHAPVRTPQYAAEMSKALAHSPIISSSSDGGAAAVPGLQAPSYYIYGRIMDDPSADWQEIYNEFIIAAFAEVAPTMSTFFDLQDKQLALFSDHLAFSMPLRNLARQRVSGHSNKWYFLTVYTPEYILKADNELTKAERDAKSPDVKARLHLIRIEFDYLRGLAKILMLQDAWQIHPTQATLGVLIDALDSWRGYLKTLADETALKNLDAMTGPIPFKPLDDWPEMRPFATEYYQKERDGDYYRAALLKRFYQQTWYTTSLAWDTAAIRDGILTNSPEIKVLTAMEAPAIESKTWESAPKAMLLRSSDGMPVVDTPTVLQVQHDTKNLYVRIHIKNPSVYLPHTSAPKTEEDVLKRHRVELSIQPEDNGPIYHLAVNPIDNARYDAIIKPRAKTDASWKGDWTSLYQGGETKGWLQNQHSLEWTVWFEIPFATLDAEPPKSGDVWRFNASREGPSMIWSKGGSVSNPQTLGKLKF
ncbi:MAG: DUF4838 domain-containing protein [Kiritimatiellia bacterium]